MRFCYLFRSPSKTIELTVCYRENKTNPGLILELAQYNVLIEGHTVHADIETSAEQEDARQLAMDGVDLLRRRAEAMRHHRWHQSGQSLRRVLFAEIKVAVVAKDLAEDHHRIDMRLLHLLRLVAGEEAHLARHLKDAVAIVLRRTDDHLAIVPDEVVLVEARRSKVDQHQASTVHIVQKIRPVRIRLHALDLEELAQAELQYRGGDVSAMIIAGERINREKSELK